MTGRVKGATLFSGIGAPEVAAPWVDWRWSADIDDFANAVRDHHWPEVPNLGDVAAIRDPEPVDLIVFGSPCQSFSVAGKRLGMDDSRGNLALVALALVARLRPTWFVFENVPGLRSSFSGSEQAESAVREGPVGGWAESDEDRDFATFLSRAQECGYLGAWWSPDAQFAGVPQRRERIFFVGYLGDWRPPAAVLFEPESLRWNPPPRREAGERVAEGAPLGAGSRGFNNTGQGWWNDARGVASTVRTHGGGSRESTVIASTGHTYETETLIAHSLRGEGFDASEDGTGRGTPLVAHCFDARQSDVIQYGDRTGPLDTDGYTHAVAFDTTQITSKANRSSPRPGGPCHPLAAGAHPPDIAGPMVRRLTPRECERLQGFPDDFTLIHWRGGMAPDGRRYKALGNSMAVPVIGWILNRIRKFEVAE